MRAEYAVAWDEAVESVNVFLGSEYEDIVGRILVHDEQRMYLVVVFGQIHAEADGIDLCNVFGSAYEPEQLEQLLIEE